VSFPPAAARLPAARLAALPAARLAALPAALGAAVLLAAGCTSGTSGTSGRAAAAQATAQVAPAARALYQRLYDARIGWSPELSGNYEKCLGSSNQNELDYHGIIYYIYPFSPSVPVTTYRQEVMTAARDNGWTFEKYIKGSRDGNLFPDQMEKGPLNGHVAVVRAPPGTGSHKFSALIEIESACFDAGSAASSLLNQHMSQSPLPHPSPLPPA
jgi:hypothetical protein